MNGKTESAHVKYSGLRYKSSDIVGGNAKKVIPMRKDAANAQRIKR